MIADSTAVAASNHDELAPLDVNSLSRERALELIREGRQVRRVLGIHPVETLPSADPPLSAENAAIASSTTRSKSAPSATATPIAPLSETAPSPGAVSFGAASAVKFATSRRCGSPCAKNAAARMRVELSDQDRRSPVAEASSSSATLPSWATEGQRHEQPARR